MVGKGGLALRTAMAGMLAMAVAMGIGRFVYTPILPMMNAAGELSMATGGLLAGANFLGYLVGALGATLPLFMAERRRWFYLALALSVATSLAMAIDLGFAYMAVIRFASGVASAFAMIFISALVMARLQAEKSPQLVALHFCGVGLGISVSAISVALVDNAALGWQMAWLVAGVLSLAGWLAIRFILPPTLPEVRHRAVAGSSRKRSGGIVLFILGYGLFGFGYVITATFINAMARAEPVLAPIEPWVWLVVGLAGMPSIWFWNRLAARIGAIAAYALACLVEAAGICASLVFVAPWALLVSAALLGFTFIAVTAIGLAKAREMAPDNPASMIAWMTVAFGAGQMAGPVIAGWLFERTASMATASSAAAVTLIVSAALAPLAWRLHEQSQTPSRLA